MIQAIHNVGYLINDLSNKKETSETATLCAIAAAVTSSVNYLFGFGRVPTGIIILGCIALGEHIKMPCYKPAAQPAGAGAEAVVAEVAAAEVAEVAAAEVAPTRPPRPHNLTCKRKSIAEVAATIATKTAVTAVTAAQPAAQPAQPAEAEAAEAAAPAVARVTAATAVARVTAAEAAATAAEAAATAAATVIGNKNKIAAIVGVIFGLALAPMQALQYGIGLTGVLTIITTVKSAIHNTWGHKSNKSHLN